MATLTRAYRAAQEAQMRRIRMQLALHGLRCERDEDRQELASKR